MMCSWGLCQFFERFLGVVVEPIGGSGSGSGPRGWAWRSRRRACWWNGRGLTLGQREHRSAARTDLHECENGRSGGGHAEAGAQFGRYARVTHRLPAALADEFQVWNQFRLKRFSDRSHSRLFEEIRGFGRKRCAGSVHLERCSNEARTVR